jgi:hypothetical protein
VKRFLQLFPEILVKESTKSDLSLDEFRTKVYQLETKRYVERNARNPLEFKPDAFRLTDILRCGHEQVLQLQMVDCDKWTGLIKVHQVLQKTVCLNESQYTVLTLERLLRLNMLMDFSKLVQSTPYLLLMACEKIQLVED